MKRRGFFITEALSAVFIFAVLAAAAFSIHYMNFRLEAVSNEALLRETRDAETAALLLVSPDAALASTPR
ncbi:MAG: hypothetical protein RRY12_00575 [Cloacibacillus sp.]